MARLRPEAIELKVSRVRPEFRSAACRNYNIFSGDISFLSEMYPGVCLIS